MIRLCILCFLFFAFIACQQSQRPFKRVKEEVPWKTIQIGGYYLDFPADFKLVEEQGIDSYVGRVRGDSIEFGFDFGYYSGELGPTPEEYIQDSTWVMEAGYQFMEPEKGYTHETLPRPQVLSMRPAVAEDSCFSKGCDFIASCNYKGEIFDHDIYIPEETEGVVFKTDTIDYQYRRIAIPKNSLNGYTGMYIRDLASYSEALNGHLALSIGADSLTKHQQELVIKIFSTVRPAR